MRKEGKRWNCGKTVNRGSEVYERTETHDEETDVEEV